MFPLYDDNPTRRPPIFTILFIAINCLIFALTFRMSPEQLERLYFRHGFLPVRASALGEADTLTYERETGPPLVLPVTPEAVGLTLLSCMFLHGGLLHVAGNMWFLWIFGNNIEDRLGHFRFVLFYLLTGAAATGCHYLIDRQSAAPVIGASGAVAGVMGAYAVLYPFARVRTLVVIVILITTVDLPALVVLGFWFLGQLLSATGQLGMDLNGGVAFWAHVGGFVAGALLIYPAMFGLPEEPPLQPAYRPGKWG